MKDECSIKRCEHPTEYIILGICAEGHIEEFLLCESHANFIWGERGNYCCPQLHTIVEHMAAKINGDEPDDIRFYQNEWVAVKDNKVLGHADAPHKLYTNPKIRGIEGTTIYKLKEDEGWIYMS